MLLFFSHDQILSDVLLNAWLQLLKDSPAFLFECTGFIELNPPRTLRKKALTSERGEDIIWTGMGPVSGFDFNSIHNLPSILLLAAVCPAERAVNILLASSRPQHSPLTATIPL